MKSCKNCKNEFKKNEMMLIQNELYNIQKIRVCKKCAQIILHINTKKYQLYKNLEKEHKNVKKRIDPYYDYLLKNVLEKSKLLEEKTMIKEDVK